MYDVDLIIPEFFLFVKPIISNSSIKKSILCTNIEKSVKMSGYVRLLSPSRQIPLDSTSTLLCVADIAVHASVDKFRHMCYNKS